MFPTVMLILNVSSVAVLWFGGHRVDAGQMQIGALTAFLAYLVQILMSVMMATFMLMMVPRAVGVRRPDRRGARHRVVRRTARRAGHRRSTARGELELRGVEFTYPGAERAGAARPVASPPGPGETTAIIGSTGAGKTTLVNLVPRLFDVTAGEVCVDGVDVRDARAASCSGAGSGWCRRRRSCSPARSRSNLRYGKPDATEDEMWRALEIAQGRDFVEAMPEGLDAPITQGGTNVSGGQRQRLAIARALIRQPEIYLFDDSFSRARPGHRRAAAGGARPGDHRVDRA